MGSAADTEIVLGILQAIVASADVAVGVSGFCFAAVVACLGHHGCPHGFSSGFGYVSRGELPVPTPTIYSNRTANNWYIRTKQPKSSQNPHFTLTDQLAHACPANTGTDRHQTRAGSWAEAHALQHLPLAPLPAPHAYACAPLLTVAPCRPVVAVSACQDDSCRLLLEVVKGAGSRASTPSRSVPPSATRCGGRVQCAPFLSV